MFITYAKLPAPAPYQSGYYRVSSTVPRQFGGTLQFNF
jgi:hypothetical protein